MQIQLVICLGGKNTSKYHISKCAFNSCIVSFAVTWLSVSGNEWLVFPSQ